MNVPKFGPSHAVPSIHMQIFRLCRTHCHCNDDDDDEEREEYDDDNAVYSYANIAPLQNPLSL